MINARRFDLVPDQMRSFVFAGGKRLAGLVARRNAEAELWASGVPQKPPAHVVGPTAPAVAVLAPATVLAAHTHSPLLPIVLGVSLALALAWVVITYLKGKSTMATSDAFNQAVANLVAAFNAKVAAASDTSALDAANAHIADLTNQLAAAQAAVAQTDADDTAAIVAATPA